MNRAPSPPEVETDAPLAATPAALKLALAYALFAGLWIVVSDELVAWLFSDADDILLASTLKGWLFVIVTSLLLFGLVQRQLAQALALSRRELAAQAENKRTQQLLAAVVDGSSDAIFAKDLNGCYLLFNRASARVTNHTALQVLGHDDGALFPPAQADTIRSNDQRVMNENQTNTFEESLNTVNGERTFLATKGPLHDHEGRVIGMFGISRDITERKAKETQLRQLSQALHQSTENIVITNMKAEIEYVNDAFLSATGFLSASALCWWLWWPRCCAALPSSCRQYALAAAQDIWSGSTNSSKMRKNLRMVTAIVQKEALNVAGRATPSAARRWPCPGTAAARNALPLPCRPRGSRPPRAPAPAPWPCQRLRQSRRFSARLP